ncbi:hypothetical protein HDU93_009794 [Gonapodya sp. JEL0774]|nr:hypothetical protein HDU93_009794 [Gonapodya sp. JEL0774]
MRSTKLTDNLPVWPYEKLDLSNDTNLDTQLAFVDHWFIMHDNLHYINGKLKKPVKGDKEKDARYRKRVRDWKLGNSKAYLMLGRTLSIEDRKRLRQILKGRRTTDQNSAAEMYKGIKEHLQVTPRDSEKNNSPDDSMLMRTVGDMKVIDSLSLRERLLGDEKSLWELASKEGKELPQSPNNRKMQERVDLTQVSHCNKEEHSTKKWWSNCKPEKMIAQQQEQSDSGTKPTSKSKPCCWNSKSRDHNSQDGLDFRSIHQPVKHVGTGKPGSSTNASNVEGQGDEHLIHIDSRTSKPRGIEKDSKNALCVPTLSTKYFAHSPCAKGASCPVGNNEAIDVSDRTEFKAAIDGGKTDRCQVCTDSEDVGSQEQNFHPASTTAREPTTRRTTHHKPDDLSHLSSASLVGETGNLAEHLVYPMRKAPKDSLLETSESTSEYLVRSAQAEYDSRWNDMLLKVFDAQMDDCKQLGSDESDGVDENDGGSGKNSAGGMEEKMRGHEACDGGQSIGRGSIDEEREHEGTEKVTKKLFERKGETAVMDSTVENGIVDTTHFGEDRGDDELLFQPFLTNTVASKSAQKSCMSHSNQVEGIILAEADGGTASSCEIWKIEEHPQRAVINLTTSTDATHAASNHQIFVVVKTKWVEIGTSRRKDPTCDGEFNVPCRL